MRFLTMIKSVENSAAGAPPPELHAAIATLGGEAAQAGVLVDTAGLMPTAAGARIRLTGGRLSLSEGPFAGGEEVVGGYAIFEVNSKQEVLDWSRRFMNLHKEHWKGWEGETEIRQLFGGPEPAPRAP